MIKSFLSPHYLTLLPLSRLLFVSDSATQFILSFTCSSSFSKHTHTHTHLAGVCIGGEGGTTHLHTPNTSGGHPCPRVPPSKAATSPDHLTPTSAHRPQWTATHQLAAHSERQGIMLPTYHLSTHTSTARMY